MSRKLVVEIVGDSRSLERAFARSSKSAQKFNQGMTQQFTGTISGFQRLSTGIAGFGALIAGSAVVGGISKMVSSASDLNEEINKTEVVFGRSGKAVIAWSETTAEAIGLSQKGALEAAGNFGGMFRTIGLGTRESSQMSRRLVQLGADMASFNNEDPTEMLERLRSGLAGEAEPLRRFQILISEGRVKTEAYRLGIARAGAELTEQQKVQARYNLILKDSTLAQGDFERTSDSLANQQRILRAQFDDMTAALGQALLPAVTGLITKTTNWLSTGDNQERLIADITTGFEAMATTAEFTADSIGLVKDAIDKVTSSREFFQRATAEEAGPLGKPLGGFLRTLTLGPGQVVKMLSDVPWKEAGEKAGTSYTTGFINSVKISEHLNQVAQAVEFKRKNAPPPPPPVKKPKGITTSQRNQWFDAKIARELNRLQDLGLRGQLARLRAVAAEVRQRLSVTKDATRRLTLEDQLLGIYREQRSVQEQITDQIQTANAALKERADAIKSAVLEKLQRRQTSILNQRAIAEAKEQLRIARQLGGGITGAKQRLADARFEALQGKLEAAPARLTAGGKFTMGGVVININGITDPEAVANRVAAVLKKRQKHTTSQSRGPAAAHA